MTFDRTPPYTYEDLLYMIRLLRSENGCPWDRVQTHESIRRGLLEEAYEVAEAIDDDSAEHLKEELGDLLFAAVKVGRFLGIDAESALHAACDKFIARYRRMECASSAENHTISQHSLDELLRLWDNAKDE